MEEGGSFAYPSTMVPPPIIVTVVLSCLLNIGSYEKDFAIIDWFSLVFRDTLDFVTSNLDTVM